MTNYERVKSMTVHELAKFITQPINGCMKCRLRYKECDGTVSCIKAHERWLKKQYKE